MAGRLRGCLVNYEFAARLKASLLSRPAIEGLFIRSAKDS